jgi:hypothetical protein
MNIENYTIVKQSSYLISTSQATTHYIIPKWAIEHAYLVYFQVETFK